MKTFEERFDEKFNIFNECNPPSCHNMIWKGNFNDLKPFFKEELKKKDEELKKNIGQLRQYLNERTEKKPIASTELEIFLLH